MNQEPSQQSNNPLADVESLSNDSVAAPLAGHGDDHQPSAALASATGDMRAAPVRSLSGSLDSVFTIICALAGLGLVATLYALISQNNAYFDREFAQLQRETAALNARLSAVNDRGVNRVPPAPAPATAPEGAVVEPPPASMPDASPETITAAPADVAVLPDTPVPDTLLSDTPEDRAVVVPGSEMVEVAEVAEVAEVVEEAEVAEEAEVDGVVEREEIQSQRDIEAQRQIDALHVELQSLRAVVEAQDQRIQQLLEQGVSRLNSAVEDDIEVISQPVAEDDAVPNTGGAVSEPQIVTLAEDSTLAGVGAALSDAQQLNADRRLSDAYQAYQQMDYPTALSIYQSIVTFDPYHREASLGVAASAIQTGDYARAEQLYRHLLSIDALDAVAFSGLLELVRRHPQRSIVELELQQHTEQHGSPGVLTALLGNHFAGLGRWRDAEAALANALQGQSDNTDLIFNYAVVLDNLGLQQRAVEFYQRALDASAHSEHTFDAGSARMRLDALHTE